jgi:hypothetical protein
MSFHAQHAQSFCTNCVTNLVHVLQKRKLSLKVSFMCDYECGLISLCIKHTATAGTSHANSWRSAYLSNRFFMSCLSVSHDTFSLFFPSIRNLTVSPLTPREKLHAASAIPPPWPDIYPSTCPAAAPAGAGASQSPAAGRPAVRLDRSHEPCTSPSTAARRSAGTSCWSASQSMRRTAAPGPDSPAETNRTQLVLFGIQNSTSVPYFAAHS